jgi:hypothetical protein
MKLPTLFIPITPRGTVAFDPEGDPLVFTKPWLAIKAAQRDETVVAFQLIAVPRPTLVASIPDASPYTD